jgi:hypothetical protein
MREDDRRSEGRGYARRRRLGFYTEEVRDATGQRIGFQVTSLEGKRGELARKDPRSGPRVGSYWVNVKAFEEIALPSMEAEAGRVLLIDEIGKMECCSGESYGGSSRHSRRITRSWQRSRCAEAAISLIKSGAGRM